MQLWDGYEERVAPGTGRRALQLTSGRGTSYPLYYFIPTFSSDAGRIVYHRAERGEVQLFSFDLATGESTQLTTATAEKTHWIPWCVDSGRGVLDHRSCLDATGDRVIYFDGNEARSVGVDGNDDRSLFRLKDDRLAIGQNCVSPDGEWFFYIHHDRELYDKVYPGDGSWNRSLSRGTALAGFNLNSGEHRTLVVINSPIHHVLPYGEGELIFCHPATENGMLLTDYEGGWYTHERTQDERGGCVCHYVATERGIAYEILDRPDGVWSGIYNPRSHARYEFPLPREFGYTHTGRDPEGALWFFETECGESHELWFLERHNPGSDDVWRKLTGNWPTYGGGQKSHFHPQVAPGREWLLMTGGDSRTESNHLFLLDISDLEATRGIPTP